MRGTDGGTMIGSTDGGWCSIPDPGATDGGWVDAGGTDSGRSPAIAQIV